MLDIPPILHYSEAYEEMLLPTKFTEDVVFLSTRFPSIHEI